MMPCLSLVLTHSSVLFICFCCWIYVCAGSALDFAANSENQLSVCWVVLVRRSRGTVWQGTEKFLLCMWQLDFTPLLPPTGAPVLAIPQDSSVCTPHNALATLSSQRDQACNRSPLFGSVAQMEILPFCPTQICLCDCCQAQEISGSVLPTMLI